MLTIKDLTVSKELDVSATSTVRGGGSKYGPPCLYNPQDDVAATFCSVQETYYEVFGFLLGGK
jgi:hypothetical protein